MLHSAPGMDQGEVPNFGAGPIMEGPIGAIRIDMEDLILLTHIIESFSGCLQSGILFLKIFLPPGMREGFGKTIKNSFKYQKVMFIDFNA
jgi:hypothetical protein